MKFLCEPGSFFFVRLNEPLTQVYASAQFGCSPALAVTRSEVTDAYMGSDLR
jgi:hypothetical protein